jgi:uncharacterized protein
MVYLASTWSVALAAVQDKLATLATVFLGIFFEAIPFLLLGVLASSFLRVFVSDELLARWVPRQRVPAAAIGALLGLAFPVCDCGAIPVSRRLVSKGAPVPTAVAFMLAAPVLNPIVLASTWIALGGISPVLALARFGLVWAVAVLVALVFTLHGELSELLSVSDAPGLSGHEHGIGDHHGDLRQRVGALLRHATDEFFEMGKYLVVGALLAAGLQAVVPRATLAAFGQDPILSILAMMALAVLLSVCSTVDAFVALSFLGTFTPGAILSFLAFGPLVDFKSTLMYATILRRRALLLVVILCAQLIFLVAAFVNLNLVPV